MKLDDEIDQLRAEVEITAIRFKNLSGQTAKAHKEYKDAEEALDAALEKRKRGAE